MQYWFQGRDASSVPLEDPDRGTDEAALCVVQAPLGYSVQGWPKT